MTSPDERVEEGGPPPGPTVQLILLRTGGHRFGMPILDVREVLPPRRMTRLPEDDGASAGLLNVRGSVLTILDFGRILGLGESRGESGSRIVILDDGTRRAGLVVGEVGGVLTVREDAVETSREALAVFPVNQPYLVGVGEDEDGAFAVIDAGRLMDRWLG